MKANGLEEMMYSRIFAATALLLLVATEAYSWNLGAMKVNALTFNKDGSIRFTLFKKGSSVDEFLCGPAGVRGNQWFRITACRASDAQCIAAVDRMASTLLSAKLAKIPVHVQRSACEVTQVALKPMR